MAEILHQRPLDPALEIERDPTLSTRVWSHEEAWVVEKQLPLRIGCAHGDAENTFVGLERREGRSIDTKVRMSPRDHFGRAGKRKANPGKLAVNDLPSRRIRHAGQYTFRRRHRTRGP